MANEYHPIQRKVLNDLLFGNNLKYSQLKSFEMEGSQFTFHLKKLIDAGLITKQGDRYSLTYRGKDIANSFDADSKHPTRQAKQSVVFCAFRMQNGKQQTLLYTRKKSPFYDHQGYPTGKVMWGESILKTAERELCEETGLTGKAELVGVRHIRVYYPTKEELVEDKVMYICKINDPVGMLRGNAEGDFYWVELDKVNVTITKPLPEFKEILKMLSNFSGEITFAESNHYPLQF